MPMSAGTVNARERTAALRKVKETLIEGIHHAQQVIDGSVTILILQENRIIAARDRLGRLPVLVGKGEDGCCVSFESFAYSKLGYADHYELGPGEIVSVTAAGVEPLSTPGKEMKICAFLCTYDCYPNSHCSG